MLRLSKLVKNFEQAHKDTIGGDLYSLYIAWVRKAHLPTAFAPQGYTRPTVHISAVPCLVSKEGEFKSFPPRDFLDNPVFCTDGHTIGHHKPGECPFRKG